MVERISFTFSEPGSNGNRLVKAMLDGLLLAEEWVDVSDLDDAKKLFKAAANELPSGFGTQQQNMELLYSQFCRAVRKLPTPAKPHISQEADSPPPREIIPAKPFPVHVLPGAVGEFVREAAAAIGCDVSFVALPMLACLARAVGNNRTIKLKRTWTEPAIIWAAIVGKSGTHKSPALAAATAPLNRKQAEAQERYHEELKSFEVESNLYERNLAQWKRTEER